jgi:hypothetical protein
MQIIMPCTYSPMIMTYLAIEIYTIILNYLFVSSTKYN